MDTTRRGIGDFVQIIYEILDACPDRMGVLDYPTLEIGWRDTILPRHMLWTIEAFEGPRETERAKQAVLAIERVFSRWARRAKLPRQALEPLAEEMGKELLHSLRPSVRAVVANATGPRAEKAAREIARYCPEEVWRNRGA